MKQLRKIYFDLLEQKNNYAKEFKLSSHYGRMYVLKTLELNIGICRCHLKKDMLVKVRREIYKLS